MSDFAAYAREVATRLAALEAENERLRLRLDNMIREGRVTKLDPEKARVEVDMNGLASDELPWSERNGASRSWDPPAVGERVVVLSPTGEPGLGIVYPGGPSDQFPQPHNKGAEFYKTIGASSILMTGEKIVFTVGGSSVTIEAGVVTIRAPAFKGVKG
jgi:phage baseplate assembly protein V